MAYELEQLAADIRAALAAEPGTAGRQAACRMVEKALRAGVRTMAYELEQLAADIRAALVAEPGAAVRLRR